MPSVKVASVSQIPEGGGRCVEVEGRRIALFKKDGEIYAIDDTCTHDDGPLSEGELEGHEVVCPWHGAMFDLRSGEVTSPPAYENVATYKVRIEGDDVEIELAE